MYCPTCKMDVQVNNQYCSRCGTYIAAKLCPNGHVMDASWTNCLYCSGGGASNNAGGGGKGRTLVEPGGGGGQVPSGGFTKGATLLERGGAPASGRFGKGGTVQEPGSGPGSKNKTTYDPGDAPKGLSPSGMTGPKARLVGWLVSFSNDTAGADYRLREGRNVVGSDRAQCDIIIEGDASVSSVHSYVMFQGESFRIRDNDSMNGTFVNGENIFGTPCELKNGDVVRFGNTECVLYAIKR